MIFAFGMIFASAPDYIDGMHATTLVLYYTAKIESHTLYKI